MAIKLAQTKTGTSTLASTVIAFDNNVVAGNLIMVAVATNLSTDVSGITDTLGNVYVNAFVVNGTGIEAELWYAKNVLGGANTVTIAYTSAPTASAIIREYSGVDTVTVLDQAKTATGNSSTLDSGTSTRINQNLELLIGVGAAVSATFTAGGSFVNLAQQANATIDIGIEDLFVTSTGTYNATFGASGSIQWACGLASLRVAPQGTTTSTSSTSMSSTSSSSTSSSISSTSSSISTSSTSISQSSISTSSTSSSISTSSTSSSISSTSSSTSSTSISSTSSSTSISSTSSSISSTSVSSTSNSSTSSSTSRSSTSTSFSSTSSSISSTSASTSSTSFSSTSSSSSTSTTTVPFINYDYTDSLIDLLPTSISGCMAWYDFSDTSTITSSGGAVSQVNDKSGNTRNVTQSVAGSKPTTGTKTMNGLNVLYFDGGDSLASANITQAQPITAFAIGQLDTAGGSNRQMLGNSSVTPTLFQDTTTAWAYYAGTGNDATGASSNRITLLSAVFNGASSKLYVDGVLGSSGNPGANGYSTKPITIGNDSPSAAAPWLGKIGEIIIYSSALSDTDRQRVERYLLLKWRDSTSTPSPFNAYQVSNVTGDDGDYFIQYGSEYMLQRFKKTWTNNTDTPTFTWRGRTTESTLISPILIQIYNVSSATWETLANVNTIPADTDFSVTVSQTTNVSNYYDSRNSVTFRSYQQVL